MLELPLHSSVDPVTLPVDPPKTTPEVAVPLPPSCVLAVFISVVSTQLTPFQSSVLAVTDGTLPPAAMTAVLFAPNPARLFAPVFKSLTSVQLDPFHDSVIAVSPAFPKHKAEVSDPAPPASLLVVFKSLTSVQLDPFQSSVTPKIALPGFSPPKAKAASSLQLVRIRNQWG